MNWLITFRSDLKRKQIAAVVDQLGGKLIENPPIPLGDEEQIVEVIGPRELFERAQSEALILDIHPNSDLTLY